MLSQLSSADVAGLKRVLEGAEKQYFNAGPLADHTNAVSRSTSAALPPAKRPHLSNYPSTGYEKLCSVQPQPQTGTFGTGKCVHDHDRVVTLEGQRCREQHEAALGPHAALPKALYHTDDQPPVTAHAKNQCMSATGTACGAQPYVNDLACTSASRASGQRAHPAGAPRADVSAPDWCRTASTAPPPPQASLAVQVPSSSPEGLWPLARAGARHMEQQQGARKLQPPARCIHEGGQSQGIVWPQTRPLGQDSRQAHRAPPPLPAQHALCVPPPPAAALLGLARTEPLPQTARQRQQQQQCQQPSSHLALRPTSAPLPQSQAQPWAHQPQLAVQQEQQQILGREALQGTRQQQQQQALQSPQRAGTALNPPLQQPVPHQQHGWRVGHHSRQAVAHSNVQSPHLQACVHHGPAQQLALPLPHPAMPLLGQQRQDRRWELRQQGQCTGPLQAEQLQQRTTAPQQGFAAPGERPAVTTPWPMAAGVLPGQRTPAEALSSRAGCGFASSMAPGPAASNAPPGAAASGGQGAGVSGPALTGTAASPASVPPLACHNGHEPWQLSGQEHRQQPWQPGAGAPLLRPPASPCSQATCSMAGSAAPTDGRPVPQAALAQAGPGPALAPTGTTGQVAPPAPASVPVAPCPSHPQPLTGPPMPSPAGGICGCYASALVPGGHCSVAPQPCGATLGPAAVSEAARTDVGHPCKAEAQPQLQQVGGAEPASIGGNGIGGGGCAAATRALGPTVAGGAVSAAADGIDGNSAVRRGGAPARRLPASLVMGSSATAAVGIGLPGGSGSSRAALPSIAEVRAAKAAAAAVAGSGAAGAQSRPRMPTLAYAGCVRYAASAVEVDWLCGQLLEAQPSMVGFDMEWRPQYVAGSAGNPTALVQICYPVRSSTPGAGALHASEGRDCCCLLLHVVHSGVTPRLRALLEAEQPRKCGVNITGDAAKMKRDYGVEMKGLLELDSVANERVLQVIDHVTVNTEYRSRWSLAALVEISLRRYLPKPNNIRCGNWERRPLDAAQQRYAALDAYAGLAVWAALARLPYRRTVPAATQSEPAQPAADAPVGSTAADGVSAAGGSSSPPDVAPAGSAPTASSAPAVLSGVEAPGVAVAGAEDRGS